VSTLTRLAENLFVHHGVINVGVLREGSRALLIDCGDGDVEASLGDLGIAQVSCLLFTHHHRDQASGAALLSATDTHIGVPAAEATWFADVESYWNDPAHRWHLYDFRPHRLMLAESIPVDATYEDGDTIQWGGATISVLSTPGHTDGSVSYLVDLGTERYLFCGDVLYGPGQVWDLFSLQKGWVVRDYHGFLGDRNRLTASLRKLGSAQARAWVPSHGQVIADPTPAVDLLCERLDTAYEKYVAISALRHYFPGMFRGFRQGPRARPGDSIRWRADLMPVREGRPPPDFLRHVGTSWIVRSEDGAAFVVDCGDPSIVREIQRLQARGELGKVEWLWITHYHDDHVDAVPQFVEAFACPVVADEHVALVIEDPLSWRLPCISPVEVRVDRRTRHGDSWRWHEFTVTAYHLPGQTLYHGGLLIEGRGHRTLFCGDSFTMAGIDDYCAGNRNWLGQGVGFDASIRLVQDLEPDVILNCHVDAAFDFTETECRTMRANLVERERLYGELLPWDHPNYGIDEAWVRCRPYEQRTAPGEIAQLQVAFTNHSEGGREATACPALPRAWHADLREKSTVVAPKQEGSVTFLLTVPADASPGRWVVPVDVTYDGRRLGQLCEAIIVVDEHCDGEAHHE
jgi:glyoxylase-like metal-dependent hydrolase (beta-lactamase superfamily II)